MSRNRSELVGLYNCGYYRSKFLEKVEEEIQRKALRVRLGVDSFSSAEQLAYMVLKSQGYFAVEAESAEAGAK
jgi:hypothetical protein